MIKLWRWVMVDRKRINATVSDLAGSCSVSLARCSMRCWPHWSATRCAG